MIKIVKGDILDAKEDIICQQVNCQGVMGSGLAKQIKAKYPEVYKDYKAICALHDSEKLLGASLISPCNDGKLICNIFGQLNYGKGIQHTDYEALSEGFIALLNSVMYENIYLGKTIAIPYNIGCGLGGGDWDTVYRIIEGVFTSVDYDIVLYKL